MRVVALKLNTHRHHNTKPYLPFRFGWRKVIVNTLQSLKYDGGGGGGVTVKVASTTIVAVVATQPQRHGKRTHIHCMNRSKMMEGLIKIRCYFLTGCTDPYFSE